MEKFRSTYLRLLLSVVMMSLFVGYMASISLFVHVHQIDGHTVAHSHPYSGSSDLPGHSHSQQQLLAISLLSTFFALQATTQTFHFIDNSSAHKILLFVFAQAERKVCASYLLRAPPAYTI